MLFSLQSKVPNDYRMNCTYSLACTLPSTFCWAYSCCQKCQMTTGRLYRYGLTWKSTWTLFVLLLKVPNDCRMNDTYNLACTLIYHDTFQFSLLSKSVHNLRPHTQIQPHMQISLDILFQPAVKSDKWGYNYKAELRLQPRMQIDQYTFSTCLSNVRNDDGHNLTDHPHSHAESASHANQPRLISTRCQKWQTRLL